MTNADFSLLEPRIRDLHKSTLYALSESDQDAACLDVGSDVGMLESVGFDKVKEDWYNDLFPRQVRSADAFYKHGELYYLIEFKTGDCRNVDIHRKAYDSVIGLIENHVLSQDECRRLLYYIVVRVGLNPSSEHKDMLAHFETGIREPWDYELTPSFLKNLAKDHIYKLSGFLVRKVYQLCPSDFEKFVRNRNWSN